MISHLAIDSTPECASCRRASGRVSIRNVCDGGGSTCAHQKGRGSGRAMSGGSILKVARASQAGAQKGGVHAAPLVAPCAAPRGTSRAAPRVAARAGGRLRCCVPAIVLVSPWHCGFGL